METKAQAIERLRETPRMPSQFSPANLPKNRVGGLIQLCEHYILPEMIVVECGRYNGVSTEVFALFAASVFSYDNQPIRKEAADRLRGYDNVYCRQKGTFEAVNDLATEKHGQVFDFVYLDNVHQNDWVSREIETWKLRTAMIGGHDYDCVNGAVREHFGEADMVFDDLSWIKVLD